MDVYEPRDDRPSSSIDNYVIIHRLYFIPYIKTRPHRPESTFFGENCLDPGAIWVHRDYVSVDDCYLPHDLQALINRTPLMYLDTSLRCGYEESCVK